VKKLNDIRPEDKGLSAWLAIGTIQKAMEQAGGMLQMGELCLDQYGIRHKDKCLYWANVRADKLEFLERLLIRRNFIYAQNHEEVI